MIPAASSRTLQPESKCSSNGVTMNILEQIDRLFAHELVEGPARGLKMVRSQRCSGYLTGEYERPVQDFLQATLRKGDVLVDVGANIGFFSMLGAQLVGESGSVHAFEPLPANASVIRRNLAVNGLSNVTLIPKAAASSSGTENIWVTTHPGGATLSSTGEVPQDARRQIRIQKTTLGHWMVEVDLDAVRMIKVDAEGAELAVLTGMSRLLEKFRPILLIELDDASRDGLRRKTEAFTDWCMSVGYNFERMENSYSIQDYQVVHFVARCA
jgi:FkbM family methyltransferase